MTTIAIWEVYEIEEDLGNPAIWIISDSRASNTTNGSTTTLTDRCVKLVEVEIRASKSGSVSSETMVMAVAGNTLVAHNVIFATQTALRNLVGPSLPTLYEVAEFVQELLINITQDVGLPLGKRAECEVILIKKDSQIPKVYSLKPKYVPNCIYDIEEIDKFPYVTGTDKKSLLDSFAALREERTIANKQNSSFDQIPIIAFDRLFVIDKASNKTGGELQMVAVGREKVRRYMPMRWNEARQQYEFYHFGIDTWDKKIGNCVIGTYPWQLDDVQLWGCKNFCVNGHLAGNCRNIVRSGNDRIKSTTRRADRQPAVWI